MSIHTIKISEFKAIHGLSGRAFSRLRERAQGEYPSEKLTELHYQRIHNNNVVLRPDLLEAFLPPKEPVNGDRTTAEDVNFSDLYARISKLEADALSQKKITRNRPVARRRSELSRVFEGEG